MTQQQNDPLSLLPSVLQHLPHLLDNPSLASSVFDAVRKASHNPRAHIFITPLLAPLTAAALIATSPQLRLDAANTCVALIRALVSRRAISAAVAYIDDLIQLAHQVTQHYGPNPPKCILQKFTKLSNTIPISSPVNEKIQPLNHSLQHPALTAYSLQSILQLLAALIPSQHSLPSKSFLKQINTNLSPITPKNASTSVSLWIAIGSSARTNIFNLAASLPLLATSCGTSTAIMAVTILQRSLDPACACLIPVSITQNLLFKIETLLIETPCLPSSRKLHVDVRIELYKLALLTSPSACISSSLWGTCGIIEAATNNGQLGIMLRNLSRSGRVKYGKVNSLFNLNQILQGLDPPSKRRRFDNQTHVSSINEDSTSTPSSQNIYSSVDTDDSISQHSIGPVDALQRCLADAGNIYRFANNPDLMRMFSNTFLLTADALKYHAKGKSASVTNIEKWLSFTSSISKMVNDVTPSLNMSASRESWETTLDLAISCTDLYLSMHVFDVLDSVNDDLTKIIQSASLPQIRLSLLESIASITSLACTALKATQAEFPIPTLSKLLWEIGELALLSQSPFPEADDLKNTCKEIQKLVVDSEPTNDIAVNAALLRCSIHSMFAFDYDVTILTDSIIFSQLVERISISGNNDSSIEPLVFAMADSVCFYAGCRKKHFQSSRNGETLAVNPQSIEGDIAAKAFQVVIPLMEKEISAGARKKVMYCIGIIGLHGSKQLAEQSAIALMRAIWHVEYNNREEAYGYLKDLLLLRGMDISTKLECPVESINEENAFSDEPWESYKSIMNQNQTDIAVTPFAETLRMGLISNHERLNTDTPSEICPTTTYKSNALSCCLVIRLFIDGLIPSTLGAFAFAQILHTSAKELDNVSALTISESAEEETETERALVSFPALHIFLSTIKQLTTTNSTHIPYSSCPESSAYHSIPLLSTAIEKSSDAVSTSLSGSIGTFILSYIQEWLPFVLETLLKKRSLISHFASMMTNGDVSSLWIRIARICFGPALCSGDISIIESLSQQAEFEMDDLILKICPDILARALIINPTFLSSSIGDGHKFLSRILKQSLEATVVRRCGKIVQRLVMELSGRREVRAERALNALGEIIFSKSVDKICSWSVGRDLLSQHFMLVMDAVNRGLFHSRATKKERVRHLQILRKVIVSSTRKLHFFIPKVLATLRLALDSMQDQQVQRTIIIVWDSFLITLGPEKARSQLTSILAILVPILDVYKNILEQSLIPIIEYVPETRYEDQAEIPLLLRMGKNAACDNLARKAERAGLHEDSSSDLGSRCKTICKIISKHANGRMEILAAQHLLTLLRKNRRWVEALRHQTVDDNSEGCSNVTLPTLLTDVVKLISKTGNKDCRAALMQCIGEIGSFHPASVLNHRPDSERKNNRSLDHAKREYPPNRYAMSAFLLDAHLVPVLINGEKQHTASSHVNRIGLVIQELLRTCGCTKDTANRVGNSRRTGSKAQPIDWSLIHLGETAEDKALYFWNNLQPSTQDAIQPYLAEPFDVHLYREIFGGNIAGDTNIACQSVWQKVKEISNSEHSPTALEWIRQVVVQLVDFIGKRSSFGETFRALRPLLRYEAGVAEFVLPLVMRTALDLQSADRRDDILLFLEKEVSEVLQEASSTQPIFDLLDTLRLWRKMDSGLSGRRSARERLGIFKASNGLSETTGGSSGAMLAESAKQADPLTKLVDLDGKADRKLSLLVQSRAAFRARSFYRSIMLAEQHTRNLRQERNDEGWPSYVENLTGKVSLDRDGNLSEEAEALNILQQSFAQLDKPDSMCGIAELRADSSLEETIRDEEAAGHYDRALTTYERAITRSPRNEDFHRGFLRCLMTLGHWETMLSHSEGLLSGSNLTEDGLRLTAESYGIEAAWRLGRWDKLGELTSGSIGNDPRHLDGELGSSWMTDFNVSFGKMLLSMRAGDMSAVKLAADESRGHLEIPLVRAAREGYGRAYPLITFLHSISDVEDTVQILNHSMSSHRMEDDRRQDNLNDGPSLIMMKGREMIVSKSIGIREQIVSTKRVCFEHLNMPDNAAKSSLQLASLASESNNLQAASASAFRALSTKNVGDAVANACLMEMAKICWKQGDSSGALGMVKKEIERLHAKLPKIDKRRNGPAITDDASNRLCTAYIVAAEWMEETRGEPSDVILHYLDNAAKFGPNREEPFYALGRHYDSLLQANSTSESKSKHGADLSVPRPSRRSTSGSSNPMGFQDHTKYVPLVIRSFAQALCNGHGRIFEAVPRMLTVWFDYYTLLDDPNYAGDGHGIEENVKKEMKKAFGTVPLYMWATAVPQLMSRLLHTRKLVREELVHLLARVVCEFTDYSFWTILPSSQLKSSERKKAAADVLNYSVQITRKSKIKDARERSRALRTKIQGALMVVQFLVDICLTTPPKDRRGRKENFAFEFKDLRNQLQGSAATNPIMPTLNSLTVRLPSVQNESAHEPFDLKPVRITDIDNFAMVMFSLMRPRRISLLGSDGKLYKYLAKKENQGDMRKDSRLVEFVTVVNRLISKDWSTRGRNLELKTYSVLPLSEETGLIEWVDNLVPLRTLVRQHQQHLPNIPETGVIQSKYQTMSDHRRFLEGWAFTKFPPVLDRFFIKSFGESNDAQRWLEARDLWSRSTAVWSMAGYVIGLGDRHGENILIETTTGRCVHVDFAMLFDKGLKLRVPEIVPFRLTRNMITAMGISGYEGVFRKSCERVMGLMRRKSNTLLGVLESFLHDPMADWTKGDIRSSGISGNGGTNKEAWQTRMVVKAKLTGLVDNSGLPLSIEGQVQRLIYEATNIDNLCEMFLWWSAWI